MPERHPDTDRYIHDCQRCGDTINPDGALVETRPVYYVKAATERNPYTADVAVALRHTDETREIRDALIDEQTMSTESANNAMARNDPNYLRFEGGLPAGVSVPESRKTTETVTRGDPDSGTERTVDVITVDVPSDQFNRSVGADPETAKHDPDVVAVRGEEVEIDRPAFLLVCPDCLDPDDTVEWSGDV